MSLLQTHLDLHQADPLETGHGLVFIIGAFRSGTTLLRKVLDSHSTIHSPAETWYLLPLLNLWNGDGDAPDYQPKQAAVAIQAQLQPEQFLECCRAFAARFYRANAPGDATWIVDKTPLYLSIAQDLPDLFPHARFIVLTRDPRGTLWSRTTWKHMKNRDIEHHLPRVAGDLKRLAAFTELAPERTHRLSYESLCSEPTATVESLCNFLEVPFESHMLAYGHARHDDGYGDEKSNDHDRPHTDSVRRWTGAAGLTEDQQRRLLKQCGLAELDALGMTDLAVVPIETQTTQNAPAPTSTISDPAPPVPAAAPATEPTAQTTVTGGPSIRRLSDRRRVLFFMHPGTVSREHLLDMADGFSRAGCDVMQWELGPIWQRMAQAGDQLPEYLASVTDMIGPMLTSNHVDLTIGMWANGVESLAHGETDGRQVSFFDALQIPHVMFWLDAPHWAHGRSRHHLFHTPLIKNKWTFHLINNPGTGAEMADLMGFSNVAALPYGVNEQVFKPYDVPEQYDIVFGLGPGDSPPTDLMREQLKADEPDQEAIRHEMADAARQRLEPLLGDVAAEGHAVMRELFDAMIQKQLDNRHAPMLQRLKTIAQARPDLAEACQALVGHPSLYVNVALTIRDIENWQRAFVISYLSRHFKCGVFGTPTLEGWDCRADYLGEVAHADQARMYSMGRLGLNVMRWQDDIGSNIKPFEISATGTACLMSQRTGMDRWFDPDREIALFDSPSQARQKATDLLADDSLRRNMAAAAMARVHSEHTWRVRATEILDVVGSVTGRFDASR